MAAQTKIDQILRIVGSTFVPIMAEAEAEAEAAGQDVHDIRDEPSVGDDAEMLEAARQAPSVQQ